MTFITNFDSPLGLLRIASTPNGLCAIGLPHEDPDSFLARVAARFPGETSFDGDWNKPYEEALGSYFSGDSASFDLPLDIAGTPFQVTVWNELRNIPFGETRSYGEVAAAIGKPLACRAVGMANSRNMIPIVIPCHRVIGSSGDLVGFTGGLEYKRFLLAHEGISR